MIWSKCIYKSILVMLVHNLVVAIFRMEGSVHMPLHIPMNVKKCMNSMNILVCIRNISMETEVTQKEKQQ